MKIGRIPLIVKVVAFQLIFLVLHFLYKFFPGNLTHLISATSESMFQHMKVVFFSYLLLTLIEFGLIRGALSLRSYYLYSRLLSAVLMPLLMAVLYLLAAIFPGRLPGTLAEILYANVVLLVLSTATFLLEEYFMQLEPSGPLKWVIVLLFLLTFSEAIAFSQRLPWFDIFAVPPGW